MNGSLENSSKEIPTMLLALLILLTSVASVGVEKPTPNEVLDLVRSFESSNRARHVTLDSDSAHGYDQQALMLDYRVESALGTPLTGTASLTITGNEAMEWIPFNAENMTITGVNEWDLALNFTYENDTLWVDRPLQPGETVTIDIDLSAPPVESNYDDGFHVEWLHVFTFSEPYGSRRWYPSFDQPFDKFDEVTVAVNMPDHWSLASNGILIETTNPEAGRKRDVYHSTDPISSYLVMIAAGDYVKWSETVNDVEIRYFAFPDDSADAAIDWERTPEMLHLYDSLCGDYPFDAYGMVMAAIFNGWGAMEHQTFTTYGSRLIDGELTYEYIVAHELVHQWFGDHLSPVDFRNMWLNEGFATYFAAVWDEYLNGEEALHAVMMNLALGYFQEDEIERYAAYDPPENRLFGRVIYNKSAWVLFMLRTQLMGDGLFHQAIRQYVASFPGGTVDTEDFITVVNDAAGENYHWFFDQWIYSAGHPELEIEIEVNQPTMGAVRVSITQSQTNAPIFRFPLTVDIVTSESPDTLHEVFWFEEQQQTVERGVGGIVNYAELADFQPLLYEEPAQTADPPGATLPNSVRLGAAYPNPFNPSTTIPFTIANRVHVRLDVFDLTGRRVRELADRVFDAGAHSVRFESTGNLASGIYFLRLQVGPTTATRKIVLLK